MRSIQELVKDALHWLRIHLVGRTTDRGKPPRVESEVSCLLPQLRPRGDYVVHCCEDRALRPDSKADCGFPLGDDIGLWGLARRRGEVTAKSIASFRRLGWRICPACFPTPP